jgi:4,5-DOPA dioxygenase extradiol
MTTSLMPVLFVGHGSPMNAIEENQFSKNWRSVAAVLPIPKAILCISAHWETAGTFVTAMKHPGTIHDFGGFPPELYQVQYPAHGSPWLVDQVKNTITSAPIMVDDKWGLDHGAWSVLCRMYPEANIPVVQLSLDYTKAAQHHYDLAKELAPLRTKEVLIVGSGNMVHNLRRMKIIGSDFNAPFGFDWAIQANDLFKKYINENNYYKLIKYESLGDAVELAIPTPEHYLPMLYALALKQEHEPIEYFNDQPVAGSLTMTSFRIG